MGEKSVNTPINKRITIPLELRDKSNLKGVEHVVVVLCDSEKLEICILPAENLNTEGLNILGWRTLDSKGRIFMTELLKLTPNWVVYLRDGQIYMRGIL